MHVYGCIKKEYTCQVCSIVSFSIESIGSSLLVETLRRETLIRFVR